MAETFHASSINDAGGTKNQPHQSTSHVLHITLILDPPTVATATGSYFILSTGQRILDGCGGAAVTSIGHGSIEVQSAICKQISRVCYTHTVAFTAEIAESLAGTLPKGNPYGLCRAFFVNPGSKATDSALKLARQYHLENNQPQRRILWPEDDIFTEIQLAP
jgi:adenosylmethionine-8-amino-7-oxononanoate aminotransferase